MIHLKSFKLYVIPLKEGFWFGLSTLINGKWEFIVVSLLPFSVSSTDTWDLFDVLSIDSVVLDIEEDAALAFVKEEESSSSVKDEVPSVNFGALEFLE